MSRRRWSHLLSEARAARSQGWPITVLLSLRDRDDPHRHDVTHINDRDRRMALALQVYEDSLCSKCGQPVWVCRGVENLDRFEVREDVCHASDRVREYVSEVTGKTGVYGEHGIPEHVALSLVDLLDSPAETPAA
ncbi:hypothetical protein [Galactobacter valiniphilus]|uniref:hypothetical protein n=1 Tax=Galactobacter valiniphilus TaxID=2676122 RepID=UPI003734CDF6